MRISPACLVLHGRFRPIAALESAVRQDEDIRIIFLCLCQNLMIRLPEIVGEPFGRKRDRGRFSPHLLLEKVCDGFLDQWCECGEGLRAVTCEINIDESDVFISFPMIRCGPHSRRGLLR